jgi:hypothetical protein
MNPIGHKTSIQAIGRTLLLKSCGDLYSSERRLISELADRRIHHPPEIAEMHVDHIAVRARAEGYELLFGDGVIHQHG